MPAKPKPFRVDGPENPKEIRDRILGTSDQRYAFLFEENIAATYLTDLEGRIIDVNRSFAQLLGYETADQIRKLSAWDLYPVPEERNEFLNDLRSFGSLKGRETRMKRRDGGLVWVLEDVRLLAEEFICGMMIDVTARKRTENEANQSREFLRLLIDSTDDVILMQSPDGRFIYANHSSSYGITPDQVLGKTPHDLFDPEAADRSLSLVATVAQTRKPLTIETPLVWRGETLWFHSRLYPVIGEHGDVVAVSTFSRNITERRRALDELRSTETQLHVEQLRTQIAADLHDDIGSLLSSIAIYASMARQAIDPTAGDAAALVGKLEENARTAMHTLDEIVWSVKPGSDELDNIIMRLREYPRELLRLRGIEYETIVEGSVEEHQLAPENRRNFYLIFREGLNNILRHSSATRVQLTLRVQSNMLTMDLHDNGEGFDTAGESPGNGLRNMQHRATKLGGTLQIESSPGRGTTLLLSCPIT